MTYKQARARQKLHKLYDSKNKQEEEPAYFPVVVWTLLFSSIMFFVFICIAK